MESSTAPGRVGPTTRRWARLALWAALIALPFAIHSIYRSLTAWPAEIYIAAGPDGGRYRVVASALAGAIERELGLEVHVLRTQGSLENLHLLQRGEVQLALYQPGTAEMLDSSRSSGATAPIATLANLYSQPLHLIVRRDGGIAHLADLRGRRVYLGQKDSGDRAMGLIALDHAGLDPTAVTILQGDYAWARASLVRGELDAMLLTLGSRAPIFDELARAGCCEMLGIDYAEALAHRWLFLWEHRIPAGMCGTHPHPLPAHDVTTVATGAELLAQDDLPSSLAQEVTAIVNRPRFPRSCGLEELLKKGPAFARQTVEFPLHSGARSFYEPTLRPFLDPDFVEATEGIRSFVVSLLIAAFLLFRWVRERRAHNTEHRIDRYLRAMLELERRQLGLDEEPGGADCAALQGLLDEITRLRQEALGEFSARELSTDRGVELFIDMCHALSDKVSSKLTRQRFDLAIEQQARPASS